MKKILTTLLLAISLPISAQTLLEVPNGVTVYVVNGESYDGNQFLINLSNDVKLVDGKNQIVFKYKVLVAQTADEVRTFESDIIVATFDTSEANTDKLKMVMPNYWSIAEAQNNIKNLTWQIKTDSGEVIPVNQDVLASNGMQLSRDYVQEVSAYNSHNNISLVNAVTEKNSPDINIVDDNLIKKKSSSDEMQSTVAVMLKFWYEKADEKTKKEFMEYIKRK